MDRRGRDMVNTEFSRVESSLERPAVLVLFVAQGHHRVDPNCAKRRDVACKEGHRRYANLLKLLAFVAYGFIEDAS